MIRIIDIVKKSSGLARKARKKSHDLYECDLTDKTGRFSPILLRVTGICLLLHVSENVKQITNRIIHAIDEYTGAADHVYVEKSGDILIDDTGLFLFGDIFMGYADQDEVIAIWRQLKDVNRLRRRQYDINKAIEQMDVAQLRALIKASQIYDNKSAAAMLMRVARPAYRKKLIMQFLSR